MHTIAKSALKIANTSVHQKSYPSVDMSRVCSVILGGGQGTRLFPLTQKNCKPAILFGGRFRLVDVPLSNSLRSGISKNYIVTQFLSASLHNHIFHTYRPDSFSSARIQILGAEQKPDRCTWYQGTADAIRQNLEYLSEVPADYFLILSGDQLYHMDFQKMVHTALVKDVDVLVATLAIPAKSAHRMGIMKVNEDHHIVDFYEKPKEASVLETLKTPQKTLEQLGLDPCSDKMYLGSMGIYLFKRSALFNLLKGDLREDFGKHLIPSKVAEGNIAAFAYDGYWEDIGTIESFYEANMSLTKKDPLFDIYSESTPIMTCNSRLAGTKISGTLVKDSIICEGSCIEATEISNSILGQRTIIKRGSIIRDSYLMGNDFYTVPITGSHHFPEEVCIEEECLIKNAIIDKNVRIGKGAQLLNTNRLRDYDGQNIFIRDGIIVVPRGADIPPGFTI
jgi:glucose-1-phosphate adenylyltransferase